MSSVIFGAFAAAVLVGGLAFAPAGARHPGAPVGAAAGRRPDDVMNVLVDVARDLRTGVSLPAAVERALAATPSILPATAAAMARGRSIDEAVALADPTTDDERLLVQAIRFARRSEGHGSQVVEHAATIVRERRAWRDERRMQSAQARLSARILTWLPMAFAMWSALTSPKVRAAYQAVPLTYAFSIAGVALNLYGWWWMRRIVSGIGT